MSNQGGHYQPIECELHDYIEIACLYGYRLLIELVDGSQFSALAVTTRNTREEEFLVLADSEAASEVRLDRILAITALDAQARFGRVLLATPAPGTVTSSKRASLSSCSLDEF
jgi:Rho-binding antiterminator